MSTRTAVALSILTLVSTTPSLAANLYSQQTLPILSLERDLQERLIELNTMEIDGEPFDYLFESIADAKKEINGVNFNLLRPDLTQAQRRYKLTAEKMLRPMDDLVASQKKLEHDLGDLIKSSASKDYFFDSFGESRVAAIKIPEDISLFNGPMLKKAKPAEQVLPGSTLGTGVREVCFYDPSTPKDILGVYAGMHDVNTSCMIKPDSATLITDPTAALNEKIKLLTGSTLDPAVITAGDPDVGRAKLNFDHAPDLESIVMGYLEFKNDFSGQMMADALRYHAKRGAQIRIILPGLPVPFTNFVKPADRKLLDSLVHSDPEHIKIQYYTFWVKNFSVKEAIEAVERCYHAKALAVLSRKQGESGVIVGGRNIKDTFYLKDAPKFPNHPEMTKYGNGSGEQPYMFFGDMEVSIRSREIAEQVISSILSFWDRDMYGPRMRRMSEHLPVLNLDDESRTAMTEKLKTTNTARFFYSVPYMKTGAAPYNTLMDKLYATLIGKAKTSIKFVNPYDRPPGDLKRDLDAALERGVRVDYVATLDFSGDNSPPSTGGINKEWFNHFIGKKGFHLYMWNTKPHSIMHAKTMLVDNELLYVGSANFDFRSVEQDNEDGFLLSGPITQDFRNRFANFFLSKCNSTAITEKLKLGLLENLLTKTLGTLETFLHQAPPPLPGEPAPVVDPNEDGCDKWPLDDVS